MKYFDAMEITPIAYFESPFSGKFGIPRQAGLAPDLRGRIVFEPPYRTADALRGLSGFDYVWLIWGFSGTRKSPSTPLYPQGELRGVPLRLPESLRSESLMGEIPSGMVEGLASPDRSHPRLVRGRGPARWRGEEYLYSGTLQEMGGAERSEESGLAEPSICRQDSGQSTAWKATVRPPRLGGNERVGVFASRSPFRPNPLGLSSVRIESIDLDAKGPDGKPLGPVINVLGADLMDGTPIFDIKPYVEYADSHPGVRSGFVDGTDWKPLEVVFPEDAGSSGLDLRALEEVLSLDPRPRYHDSPDRIYTMTYCGREVSFKAGGGTLTVTEISDIPNG